MILIFLISVVNAATYSSVGCYALSDLESYLTSQGSYTYQTNSYCENLCGGQKIAATLDGSTCYCGNTIPNGISSVSSSNCNAACQGYGTETCGGEGYLSVFSTDPDAFEESNQSSESSSSSKTTKSSTSTRSSTSTTSTSFPLTTTSSTLDSTSTTSTYISISTTSTSTSSTDSETSESGTSSVAAVTKVITTVISVSNSVETITTTFQATTTTSASDTTITTSSKLSKGTIAGIAIGSVFGFAFILAACVVFYLRSRKVVENESSSSSINTEKSYTLYGIDYSDSGVKRLSNGSLSLDLHENTLRIVNPDN